jgi:hypothetical protein
MQPSIKSICCRDSVALVSAARDQGLSVADAEQLDHHVAHCPRCQVARQQFSILFAGLDDLLGASSVPVD